MGTEGGELGGQGVVAGSQVVLDSHPQGQEAMGPTKRELSKAGGERGSLCWLNNVWVVL